MSQVCPLCNSPHYRTVLLSYAHLLKCRTCGIVFNTSFELLEYEDSYFLEDYQQQYGKTYLQDFKNLYALSMSRMQKIRNLMRPTRELSSCRVLDIGSAMGFFLKAARDMGAGDVQGVEISQYASEFCINEFNIPVHNKPFEEVEFNEKFDIITAWYFIEHCKEPQVTIDRIYHLLREGGVFAISTPSIHGPLYMLRREEWGKSHPIDHNIDFSPSTIRHYLKSIGFKNVVVRPGGIHPERIISEKSFVFPLFKRLYSLVSRRFSFSDTMDVFSLK